MKMQRFVGLVLAVLFGVGWAVAVDADEPEPDPGFHKGPMLERFLKGPMAHVEEIVFAVRVPGRDHWYVTFGNYSDHSNDPVKQRAFKFEDGVYWGYGEGGRLCKLNLRTGRLTVLLDDPKGGVRDPQVHYSGKKILFSYRKGGEHAFHLYEINSDGTGLRQLTFGPDDDIEPTYCPDDSIVFCSSRCRRFVNCWYTRVATLYRCNPDGSGIRMLSSNNDHDNTPWMMPDGRILYMRWEYVDRSQVHFHHLWTMNPDGSGQMVFYGNMHPGTVMIDAKPIPGTGKVVAIFSPGHGRPEHLGYVTIVDPRQGPDNLSAARRVTKQPIWKDPYAFSEDCFLVANPRGIYVMDGNGNAELIYELPPQERQRFQCHEPRPVVPRPREPVIAPRTDVEQPTGRVVLQDAYTGRKMHLVEKGTIKKLLVLKQLPKPVNFSGGMEPLTIGGSFTLAEIVGEVPVYEDGSAYIELPALQSLFFVALDEQDRPVKRMHSFLILQPGETLGCVGCHEQRTQGPHELRKDLLALRRPPTVPKPIEDVPSVIDYPRDIQPIWDRHCVSCHNPDRFEGMVDLTGDRTMRYTVSYWTMQTRKLISDGRNRPRGNYDPYEIGSSSSRLMQFLDGSHYGAKLSEREKRLVRLWIETSACFTGTYASLGCGVYPVYLPLGQIANRCGSCHLREMEERGVKRKILTFAGFWGGDTRPSGDFLNGLPPEGALGFIARCYLSPVCNLSRPEKSYILLAPLAKEAGGLQLCGEPVFKDKDDPLYRQILAAIQDASRRLAEGKRFDMPGFRPNEHYIREMKRFGILPTDLPEDVPLDPYAIDRKYWDSFIYPSPTTFPGMFQTDKMMTSR